MARADAAEHRADRGRNLALAVGRLRHTVGSESPLAAMTPLQVRFLTWNVHGCVGRDRVCDPDRVARVLEAAQPDISALQEIDNRTTSAARDPFAYLRQLFGWTAVPA